MRAEAVANNGSYALWSGAGPPSLPEQRASTTDDLPKRSSLMRVAGVAAASMAAALVTAEALSSIEIRLRSLGSRRCRTRVSTMFLPAWMKEYCTVENDDGDENSRRIRTQLETTGSPESCALCPACRNPGVSERLERPRATSTSSLNAGCLGTRARAEEISFCSSAEGEQTFRTFNFTGGCCAKTGGARRPFYLNPEPGARSAELAVQRSRISVKSRDGKPNTGVRDEAVAVGGSRRGRRRPLETQERARGPRAHAPARRQQGRHREAAEDEPGRLLRFLPGDLKPGTGSAGGRVCSSVPRHGATYPGPRSTLPGSFPVILP